MVSLSHGSMLEKWSGGVMKGLIQFEFRALLFPNTPILQNRSSSLLAKRFNSVLVHRTRLSEL
jgi:hypothetical protein